MLTPDENWNQVKALFERALEEEPADVGVWLDDQNVTDERVRAEVMSLLRHNSQSGSFLNDPIADRMPDLMGDARQLQPGQGVHQLQPGQVVGKYTIDREIGRGGMGRVYLATEQRLGRSVALKALSPELARDPVYRERFRREAKAVAALTHPGICMIHAFEEIDGNLYIASEFVDGHTLRKEVESDRRPTVDAIRRTAQDLASALSSAHLKGITHRDLKPENVMRTTDGHLKILDFGLALVETRAGAPASMLDNLTLAKAIVGTPGYMSPEQLNGDRADSRSDVWALGVVLYEHASGVHPFHADGGFAVMSRILNSEPVPLDRLRSDLPHSLVSVITKCLRKPPDDRFPSAMEMVEALNRVDVAPTTKTLTEIAPTTKTLTWWRIHQLAVTGLYLVACILAWQIKEWRPGVATAIFFAIGVAATVGGFFRGHLLFTERVIGSGLDGDRQRASSITHTTDLVIALALVVDGGLLAFGRPVPALLTIVLGVVIAIAKWVFEPRTTSASFPQPESG